VATVDPAEYRLEFFREMGFERRVGRKCREAFWTLNPDFEEPQDTPCVDYWFRDIKSRGPMTVSEAREAFLRFFEERGHARVEPRPVVARWREDLYLTIASIVVFQPHVTSGLVPPPANPLVISQPSIRLEDIDNVGLTIGRHLTSFEMAAHHAFNYPDKWVYWKEETVRYAYEFFTKVLGIPGELIVFKESWWEGGGNAGPSFEVAVGGLELATLVFMQYRVTDGGYEPIPLKIVDTGYGVERIAWFTQKTPTAFHAIYGPLLGRFRSKIGVPEPDERILWAAHKAAGGLDPEDRESVEAYYRRVSQLAGVSVEEAREVLLREARLYSVLDHTRTLALMLADGVVPSNSGEGYLARLVARRAMRQLAALGAEDVSLVDLVEMQVEFWGRDFPRMRENRDYILDATQLEEERFRKALRRGLQAVRRELRRKKRIELSDLVRLYDSFGVPPEIVAEAAAKEGVRVEVPHNFYSIVASMHRGPERIRGYGFEKVELPEEVVRWASGLSATRRVFHEDPYAKSLRARVAGVMGRYIAFDATVFYPTGGGQIHDTGFIVVRGRRYRIVDVQKVGDVIVHVADSEIQAEPGD
jgi:alanyl-tRNA synthetase